MYKVTVHVDDTEVEIDVDARANLRQVLLEHDLSPYTRFTSHLNCGGRGICATCGVWFVDSDIEPDHWHDKAADYFGYPRLSCQIEINEDITIRLLTDKVVWGKRDAGKAKLFKRTP